MIELYLDFQFDSNLCLKTLKNKEQSQIKQGLNWIISRFNFSLILTFCLKTLKKKEQSHMYTQFMNNSALMAATTLLLHVQIICPSLSHYCLWQDGLWSFQTGCTNIESFLHKNQRTQRKLLNFENWISGGLRSFQKSKF